MKRLFKLLIVLSLIVSLFPNLTLQANSKHPTTMYIGNTAVVLNGEVTANTSGTGWTYQDGVLSFTNERFFNSSSYVYYTNNTAEIYVDGDIIVDTDTYYQSIQYREYSTYTKCIFYVSGTLKIIGEGVLDLRIVNGGQGRAYGIMADVLDLSQFNGTFSTAGCYSATNINRIIHPTNQDLEVMGDYATNAGNNVNMIFDTYDPNALRYLYIGKVHKIHFDANGANGEMDLLYLRHNDHLNPIPNHTFTHPNNGSFLGWSLNKDASEAEYQSGEVIYGVVNDLTLYAIWDREIVNEYYVSFDANGATGEMKPQLLDDQFVVPACDYVSNDGSIFLGWSLNEDASTIDYQPNDVIQETNQNITLYAVWGSKINEVSLSDSRLILKQYDNIRISAHVKGEGNFDPRVVYQIENQTSQNTKIDQNGLLQIGLDETSSQIIVTVSSIQDPSKQAKCYVEVEEANYQVMLIDDTSITIHETFLDAMDALNKLQPNNTITLKLFDDIDEDIMMTSLNNIIFDLNEYQVKGNLYLKDSEVLLKNGQVLGDTTMKNSSLTLSKDTTIANMHAISSDFILETDSHIEATTSVILDASILYVNGLFEISSKEQADFIFTNNSRLEISEQASNATFNVALKDTQSETIGLETNYANITSYDPNYHVVMENNMITLKKVTYHITIETNGYGNASINRYEVPFDEEVIIQLEANPYYLFNYYEVVSNNVVIENDCFTMPKADVHIKVYFKPEIPFVDVDPNEWYYSSVKNIYDLSYMKATGKGNQYFEPDANITRGMIATILHRFANNPKVTYQPVFPDVKANLWYTQAILWASENNIVSGYNNGLFGVDDNIKRQDLAVMIRNYVAYCGKYQYVITDHMGKFVDFNHVDDYAVSALNWCVEHNIISGSNKNGVLSLNPQAYCTRAEAAKMFYAVYQFLNQN